MSSALHSETQTGKQAFSPEMMALYTVPRGGPQLVDVPEARFLMVNGAGNPNTSAAYREAIEALYTMSFTIRFMLKKEAGLEYRVMPLEGLWWAQDMTAFTLERKDDWLWTMMIAQPDGVTLEVVERARRQVLAKRKVVPALDGLRLEAFHEGRVAQILHLGPYSAEGPTIERLHMFLREHTYAPAGKHHEIYLGDPRRAAPDKLRTIIRQPVKLNG